MDLQPDLNSSPLTSSSLHFPQTPISILQDFCSRHFDGIVAEYHLLSSECQVQKPTFMYRVEVAGVVATASGQSKKKAKHAAAYAALKILLKQIPDPLVEQCLSASCESNKRNGSTDAPDGLDNNLTDAEMNSVGKLQELCMRKRWRPPAYQTFEEVGAPHERLFRMICEIDCDGTIIRSEGHGRSKKLAKRSAAIKMTSLLESHNYIPACASNNPHVGIDSRPETSKPIVNDKNHIDLSSTIISNPFEKLVDFMKGIGEELNQEIEPYFDDKDSCESLETIAEFLECRVDYREMESKTSEWNVTVHLQPLDKLQCPIPIATGWGSDENFAEARLKAAKRLLHIMRTIRYIE